MNEIFKEIKSAQHIEIIVDKEYLFVASALYTYILTLHKKVSLVCKDDLVDYKYSFLPWFEKIKRTDTPSADYKVVLDCSVLELFEMFKKLDIKINKKIATALYGAVLYETQGFTNSVLNGTFFAVSSELISAGAEYKLATTALIKSTTLGFLRLKSIMLEKMVLQNNAKAAVFVICDDDLKSTSASLLDAQNIMLEALELRYVEMVVLLDSDNKYEIIKIRNKEI